MADTDLIDAFKLSLMLNCFLATLNLSSENVLWSLNWDF